MNAKETFSGFLDHIKIDLYYVFLITTLHIRASQIWCYISVLLLL